MGGGGSANEDEHKHPLVLCEWGGGGVVIDMETSRDKTHVQDVSG